MPRMTPSEAFVETMAVHGVEEIFGIMGSAFMDAMDIFEPAGIRFISVVHEQGAAHMADGYSRVSGKQGVCIGQNGKQLCHRHCRCILGTLTGGHYYPGNRNHGNWLGGISGGKPVAYVSGIYQIPSAFKQPKSDGGIYRAML